jgi:hypothetical protein
MTVLSGVLPVVDVRVVLRVVDLGHVRHFIPPRGISPAPFGIATFEEGPQRRIAPIPVGGTTIR